MNKYCSICGKIYYEHGNSSKPINDGKCCDKCNLTIVISRRAQDIINEKADDKQENKYN